MPILLAGGPEPLIFLLLALVVDAATGAWPLARRVLHSPRRWIGMLARALDRRLNRPQRDARTRRQRGLLLVVMLAAGAVAAGFLLTEIVRALAQGWIVEIVLLAGALDAGRPWTHSRHAAAALAGGNAELARMALRGVSGRPVDGLDEHALVRIAVEMLAACLDRHLVAPVLWYLLAGLPGLVLWLTASVLDDAIGHQTARYEGFGMAAARLDDALGWLPARLTGLLTAAGAAFVATARPWAALQTLWRDAGKHGSINAGWPIAAFAGALGLSLGGPRREGEVLIRAAWLGDGRARARAADLAHATSLFLVSALVFVLAAGAAILILAETR